MANLFDVNRQVAESYVKAEQIKGLFLARGKMILVLLSGGMLFAGVTLAAAGRPIAQLFTPWQSVIPLIPFAVIAGLLAICIEAGTIFAAAMVVDTAKHTRKEIEVLEKVKTKIGSEEFKKRTDLVKRKNWGPRTMLFVCCGFSISGAEIFWQQVLSTQGLFFHMIGAVLGVVCSSLLVLFEVKSDVVERLIEKCISSSGLIQIALDQSAKSQIHAGLFDARQKMLASPEFVQVLQVAAEEGLYEVASEAIGGAGSTISGTQLKSMVKDQVEVRDAAEEFIAAAGEPPAIAPPPVGQAATRALPPPKTNGRRVSKHRRAVASAMKKYGAARMLADPAKYAEDLQMDVRTMTRWIDDIQRAG